MNLKSIITDDDAVSPVIGVILMVAITVILAAVIGTFVLGLGDQVQGTAPQAQFTFDYNNGADGTAADALTITHDGGDAIDAARLSFSVSGAEATDGTGSWDAEVALTDTADADSWEDLSSSEVGAGSSVTLDGNDFHYDTDGSGTMGTADGTNNRALNGVEYLTLDSSTVRIVWTNEDEKNSATLAKWTGSEA